MRFQPVENAATAAKCTLSHDHIDPYLGTDNEHSLRFPPVEPSAPFTRRAGSLCLSCVQKQAVRRIRLSRTELRIVAEQGRTVGAENAIRRAHLEIDVRVVMGCRRAGSLELFDADADFAKATIVLELGIVVSPHGAVPTRSR